METRKDYLWYFWNTDNQDWLEEFKYLWKDKTLKGLTVGGLTDGKDLPKEKDFDLEILMATQDIIKSYFTCPSNRYKKFNEDYSSYGLKNIIERLLFKITKGRLNHISNGTFILAMHHCGFKFKRIPNTPNCVFDVSPIAIRRMKTSNHLGTN